MKRANVAIFVPHLGCPHDCSFCSQRRITGQEHIPTPEEVRSAARSGLENLGAAAAQSEIAFFGGSFTAVEPALMCSMLEAAAPFVGNGGFKGIRVSTRPDAIDWERLSVLKRYGVTAVELGAQSMDDRVLALNARGHLARDVERASALIKESGFELGLQMMTGLYGDTPEGARATARALAALAPAAVRIYPTIVLRGTALAQLCEEGKYHAQKLEDAVALCAELLLFFHSLGIPVIRLGLHASEGVENGYVAGPWHPAFRELCENRIYLARARDALRSRGGTGGETVLLVKPGCVSKLAGQHGSNRSALEAEFGKHLRIRESAELQEYEVAVSTTSGGVQRCS